MDMDGSNTAKETSLIVSQQKEYYVEEAESDEHMMNDELTDTELSQDMFYEGIKNYVMKSVKRREMRQTIRNKKRKKSKFAMHISNGSDEEAVARAYSRCSIRYFYDIIKHVRKSEHRIHLVQQMGFGELLELDDCYVPRPLAQWIADNTCPDDEEIVLNNKSIPLTIQSIKDVLDLPAGILSVDGDEEAGKLRFLALFGLSEVPKIKYFGDKIKNEELEDDMFCRCFMGVTLSTFLCPNSSTKIGTKYLGALVDVDKIKDRNWCKFVHEWLISYIKKYLRDKQKENRVSLTLGGCIYQLSVRYLDFIDFGAISLPTTIPRIRVWKGGLIKIFSDMDIRKNGKYGALPVKDITETCYAYQPNSTDPEFRASIEEIVGNSFADRVKEDIITSFKNHMNGQEPKLRSIAHDLVLDILRNVKSSIIEPEDTLKIDSSGGNQNSNELINESGSTVKLPEDKHDNLPEDEQDDFQAEQELNELNPRKRAKINEFTSSQQSSSSQVKNIDDVTENIQAAEHKVYACEKTASLDYMLHTEQCTLKDQAKIRNEDLSICSPMHTEQRQLLTQTTDNQDNQLGKNEAEGKTRFSGFAKPTNHVTSMALIAEQYGQSDSSTKTKASRADYLQEAAKKYYFIDKSYPSFRLFEHLDDNGKYIEEPELWRPVGTDGNADKLTNEEFEARSIQNRLIHVEQKSPMCASSSKNLNESNYDSIQCAQKQPSYTDLTSSPEKQCQKHDYSYVDLVSPDTPSHGISSQSKLWENNYYSNNQSTEENHYSASKQAYHDSMIIGRKLFTDDELNSTNNENNIQTKEKVLQPISPEVEYLGDKSFKTRCSNMCDKTDIYYNQQMHSGNVSSSSGKENVPPRRNVNPSTFLCSPYDNNQKAVIQANTQKIYQSIVCLSEMEEFRDTWVVNIDNCRVTMEQLGQSFKPNGWVEAYVINTFCRKLFRDKHPKISKKHYFFHTVAEYFLGKWPNDYMRDKWKQNVLKGFHGAGSARPLHLADRLYFPSLFERHYFVFVVDLKNHKFVFLDSLLGKESTYHKACDNKMITSFVSTWYEAGLKNMDFNSFERIFPNVPKQKTPDDCGVFAMKLMELWCPRNPVMTSFSHLDIPGFRVQLAVDEVFNKYNTEYEAKLLIQNFNPKNQRMIRDQGEDE